MKQFYKIGEISKIYGIGKDSLMYYEDIGILNPLRDKNGYRLYNISDIWRLNLIKELRSLNFSMKKIKEYLDNRSLESTKKILNEEILLIDEKMEELLSHKNNIISRLKSMNDVIEDSTFKNIDVIYMKKRKALILNANITRDEDVDFLIQKLQKEYEERFYILGNNNIGAVFNLDKVKEGIYNQFKSVFCLLEYGEPIYNFILDEGYYLTCSYKGEYKLNKLYINNILDFAKKNGYEVSGDPIEIYKIDIHETGIEDEFITEIQIPVKLK